MKCRRTQTDANQRDHQGVTVYRFSSKDLFVREQEEHTAFDNRGVNLAAIHPHSVEVMALSAQSKM